MLSHHYYINDTEGYFLSFLSSLPYKKQKNCCRVKQHKASIPKHQNNRLSRKAITIMQIMTSNIKNKTNQATEKS